MLYLLWLTCAAVSESFSFGFFEEMAPKENMEYVAVVALVAGLALIVAVEFTGGGST